MTDLIIIAAVLVIVGLVARYIIKSKKKGVHCIGCPHAAACAAAKNGSCPSCSGQTSCSGCSSKA